MNVLLIGLEDKAAILKKGFPAEIKVYHAETLFDYQQEIMDQGVAFDLLIELDSDEIGGLLEMIESDVWGTCPVIMSSVKTGIVELVTHDLANFEEEDYPVIGLNTLPTFMESPIKEVSIFSESMKKSALAIFKALNWEVEVVKDRVGMVTPRVVCMIINEAYYTLQEGTATKEAIDTSMKLGTAYPMGPFEWAEKIGIENVYDVLNAVLEDTGDSRYKICPLLKTEYSKSFYLNE